MKITAVFVYDIWHRTVGSYYYLQSFTTLHFFLTNSAESGDLIIGPGNFLNPSQALRTCVNVNIIKDFH